MTAKEVIKKVKVGYNNKITLKKTRATVELWWEDKDKWFCNVKHQNENHSNWLIATDLEHAISFNYLTKKYKILEKSLKTKTKIKN